MLLIVRISYKLLISPVVFHLHLKKLQASITKLEVRSRVAAEKSARI